MANQQRMGQWARVRAALVATLVLSLGAALPQTVRAQTVQAQRHTIAPGGPNTIVGKVTDTLGVPVAGADVAITSLNRYARTSQNGTFRFDHVKAGTYVVSARRIGFIKGEDRVEVGTGGGSVTIQLIRVGYGLPAVVTVESRSGLSGVVADTGFRPMANVNVRVIGAGKSARTDSAGEFFLPLTSGEYLVDIEHDGYDRQTLGLTIPQSEGRRITAFMTPRNGPADHFESQALFDLHQRIIRSSPATSHYYSNEALRSSGIRDMWDLLRRWATRDFNGGCLVTIGGTNFRRPITAVTTADVEFAEVYQPFMLFGNSTRGVTSINRDSRRLLTSTSLPPITTEECGNIVIIVWLRK